MPRIPPLPRPRLRWTAREVVRDVDQRPHLLVRLDLSGGYFPARALEAFARVGRVRSRFVRVDPDGTSARAYFDEPLPPEGAVVFGYGDRVVHRFRPRFHADAVERLDRGRLPPDTIVRDR